MDHQNPPIFQPQSISIDVQFHAPHGLKSNSPKSKFILPEEILLANELIQIVIEQHYRKSTGKKALVFIREFFGTDDYPARARYLNPNPQPSSKEQLFQEVHRTLQAFEAGAYSLIVNGQRVRGLDEEITFTPGTQVVFLKTNAVQRPAADDALKVAKSLPEPTNQ